MLSKLLGIFKSSMRKTMDSLIYILEQIGPLVMVAYPIVKQIAELTPTKTDDQILAAYEKYGLRNLFDPRKDKSISLRDLAKFALVKEIGQTQKDHLLNTVIELAYAKYKYVNEKKD